MGRAVWAFVILSWMTMVGCERRAATAALPDLEIPVSCASEIVLVGCDARVNPPKCRSARVRYRRGCEEIVVKRLDSGER